MNAQFSRRSVLRGLVATAVAGSLSATRPAFARQAPESGGLGLAQADFEAVFGPGQPGQSFLYYMDPATGGEMHVGYDNGSIDYFWISWGDPQMLSGVHPDLAMTLVESLLPDDARTQETYVANESPGSLGQVATWRLTSSWLEGQLGGRSSFLVTLFRSPDANGGEVTTRATIVVEQL